MRLSPALPAASHRRVLWGAVEVLLAPFKIEFVSLFALVRVLQRNRTNRVYVYIERERNSYFKELAHKIVRAGKSEICKAGRQAGNLGRISLL